MELKYTNPKFGEKRLFFKLLEVLEFNSDRKRQSVIVQDMQTQKILLLCKGADSIVFARTNKEKSKFVKETQ